MKFNIITLKNRSDILRLCNLGGVSIGHDGSTSVKVIMKSEFKHMGMKMVTVYLRNFFGIWKTP